MKKLVLIVLIVIFGRFTYAPPIKTDAYMPRFETTQSIETWYVDYVKAEIEIAVCLAEKTRYNDYAINRTENAVGQFQIRPIMVDEVNRIVGWKKFRLRDRHSYEKSTEMFWIYQNKWNPMPTNKQDFKLWAERALRFWNGHDLDMKMRSTKRYWNSVADNFKNV